jgi:hypothetical protein
MSDRVELRTDISPTAGVRGIKQSGASRSNDGGRRFAVELDKRLHHDGEKDEREEDGDKIIVRQEDRESDADRREKPKGRESEKQPLNEEDKGNRIDYVA